MDLWAQEDVDLVAPGFIDFEADHMGSLGFIAVQGGLDWRDAPRDRRPGVEFSWDGFDEGDPATGRGWGGRRRGRVVAGPHLLRSGRRELAVEVFWAADRPGFHQEHLRQRCRVLTGADVDDEEHDSRPNLRVVEAPGGHS